MWFYGGHDFAVSRRHASEACQQFTLAKEGAGDAGCTLHPRSRAQWENGCAHEHTGSAEATDIPCVMDFAAYDVLSPVIRLV